MGTSDQRWSPENELAARRDWTGPTVGGSVLTPELAAFCQRGTGIALASCDRAGRPVIGRGLACRIGASGTVRILLRESTNVMLLQALDAGAGVAATFSQPTTHRSIQLKSPDAQRVAIAPQDGPAAHRQTAAFRDELETVGYASELVNIYTAYAPHELVAIEFQPAAAFVQTPGPSAGSALA
jgi:hypothetical protein